MHEYKIHKKNETKGRKRDRNQIRNGKKGEKKQTVKTENEITKKKKMICDKIHFILKHHYPFLFSSNRQ